VGSIDGCFKIANSNIEVYDYNGM